MKKPQHKFDKRFCSNCLRRSFLLYNSYDDGEKNLINIGESICQSCLDGRIESGEMPTEKLSGKRKKSKELKAVLNQRQEIFFEKVDAKIAGRVIGIDEYRRKQHQKYLETINAQYLENKKALGR